MNTIALSITLVLTVLFVATVKSDGYGGYGYGGYGGYGDYGGYGGGYGGYGSYGGGGYGVYGGGGYGSGYGKSKKTVYIRYPHPVPTPVYPRVFPVAYNNIDDGNGIFELFFLLIILMAVFGNNYDNGYYDHTHKKKHGWLFG